MLRLRPYKPCDAGKVASWIDNERTYQLWGGKLIGDYPLTAEAINKKYLQENGGCEEEDNFYPMSAFDEDGIAGSLIMRYIKGDNRILRFGWVVVDGSRRGKGYGKELIRLAQQYAFTVLKVDTVSIGVYECNTSAYKCYLACGFRASTVCEDSFVEIDGKNERIVELEISKDEWLKTLDENI